MTAKQADLLRLDGQLAAKEEELRIATRRNRYMECRTSVAEWRSEMERLRATCAGQLADHNLCLAKNSERRGTGGFLGCALGILAGVASGGAAMPWAMGGCGVGTAVGAGLDDVCPATSCDPTVEGSTAQALTNLGLSEVPHCGGVMGVSLETEVTEVSDGLRVVRVLPDSYAQAAGIAAGDRLIHVAGADVRSIDDVGAALAERSVGDETGVDVIRDGEIYTLVAPARGLDGSEDVKLGVELEVVTEPAAFNNGARVQRVAAGGPSDNQLEVGDIIESAECERFPQALAPLHRLDELENALNYTQPGDTVRMTVIRNGEVVLVSVVMGERTGGSGL